MIFSKIQFAYIVVMGFVSIKKYACSRTPIVIKADGKEQEVKTAIHSAGKKVQKAVERKVR